MNAAGRRVVCLALTVSLAVIPGCARTMGEARSDDLIPLRLGVGREPLSALAYIARDEGLFEANGLDVDFVEYEGAQTAHERLLAGEVDVALCTDTPIVLGALAGKPVTIFATIARDANDISILARPDAGITRPADLRGKRFGVQWGTAASFFLDSFLTLQGIADTEVTITKATHSEVTAALIRGEIDAASLREPFDTQVAQALGEDLVVFTEPGLYTKTASLCVRPDQPVDREALVRLVRAFIEAEDLMAGDRDDRLHDAAARDIGISGDALAPGVYTPGSVSLRQALILNFEDQARWAVEETVVSDPQPFDALTLLDLSVLDAVDPERVSVIR